MKINFKKKISEAIYSIKKCHDYIRDIKNIEQIIEYLGLCQQMAISIGETLEKEEKNKDISNELVERLEEYCEQIYQISLINNVKNEKIRQLLSVCDTIILDVEKIIKVKISEERMVAVFLCHIASMWDSLDSVYKSAIKDENWNSYVMPIPYYSMDMKGVIIGDNFEYDNFPKDLELIDYRKISLNELNPDIIFYINPYDEYNLLTRVHSQFFSNRLLEITDKIVYIPYYLPGENGIENIVYTPGVKNAWKIVLPNETASKYLEFFNEEKIVPLGSPKLDTLLNIKNDAIPKEWEYKIKDKKVLFFNTHLTSAMNSPDKLINMLEYILSVMDENKNIVFIWRPHPLLKVTLKANQEDFSVLDRYNNIISEFKKRENAIYDDTNNMHNSIAISDGYIGSARSSVLRIFKKLKIPFKIIPDIFDKDMHNGFCFRSDRGGVLIGNEIWQFESPYNALFKFNLKTKQTSFVTSFEKYPIQEKNLFTAIDNYKEWVILVPSTQNEILLFNTITSEVKYINIEEECFERQKFFIADVVEDTVFISYFKAKVLYAISMKDFSMNKNTLDIKGNIVGISSGYKFVFNEEDGSLTAINLVKKNQLKYNLADKLLFEKFPFVKIVDKELFIIQKDKGILYYWKDFFNINNFATTKLLKEFNSDAKIRLCHVNEGKLLFSTMYSNSIYALDIYTKNVEKLFESNTEIMARYSMDAISYGDSIYMLPYIENQTYIIKLKSDFSNVETIPVKANKNDILEQRVLAAISNKIDGKDLEFLPHSLDTWIHYFNMKSKKNDDTIMSNVGEKIWAYIVDSI